MLASLQLAVDWQGPRLQSRVCFGYCLSDATPCQVCLHPFFVIQLERENPLETVRWHRLIWHAREPGRKGHRQLPILPADTPGA